MVRRFIILSLLIISIQGCNHENMEKLDNIYPGEVLREEFMMPLEITAYRLLYKIHPKIIVKTRTYITNT